MNDCINLGTNVLISYLFPRNLFAYCGVIWGLQDMERGKYFRIAADVIVDGENLADMLIEARMAIRYDGGKKTYNWCEW